MHKPPFRIRLVTPIIHAAARRAIARVLDSGHLVAGAQAASFEQALAQLSGRRFAVALSSGTAALLAGMRAMNIGPGSTVVVPAFAFPAAAMVADFLGATVRFCDVDAHTWNMTPQTLRPLLAAEDVDLVVPVDLFGHPAPAGALASLCQKWGARLLVDAACSLGATRDQRPAGSFGDGAIFSFHPRKVVTAFEGGAFVTDCETLAATVRTFRNLGQSPEGFVTVGLNLRPSEIGFACALAQLPHLVERLRVRCQWAREYRRALQSLPLTFQADEPGVVANGQSLVVCVPESFGASGRDALITHLATDGVEACIAGWSASRVPPLRTRWRVDEPHLPNALALHQRGLALPLHENLSRVDVQTVIHSVREGCQKIELQR